MLRICKSFVVRFNFLMWLDLKLIEYEIDAGQYRW